MYDYLKNRSCHCTRCIMNDMMLPVLLIVIGALFLLEQYHVKGFHSTWPVILLVVGSIKLLQSGASMEGHRQPYVVAGIPPIPPVAPATATSDDRQVNNG